MSNAATHLSPAALEEGQGGQHHAHHSSTASSVPHKKTHYMPHVPRKMKSSRHLARERKERKKRKEAEKLKDKLPGVLHTDDNVKLRKRLKWKNELVAAVAEFCGTFLFLFFSFGIATQAGQQELSNITSTQTQNQGATLNTSQLLYSSLGFGFSLAVNAWVFFRVSGGLFNPAVTLGLFLCGAITWYRAIILFIVQFISGIAAAGIAQLVIPGGINARTVLGASTSIAQGWFIEMFCTCLLMFAIYMLAGEKHKATFLAPVGIGLALFLAELFATGLTGGSLNPARTLGPDVIAAKFEGTTWIYYTAPFAGVLLAALIYWLLKKFRYETANEGQDDDETEQALIIRNTQGHVTGAVQRVDVADAPDIPGLKQTKQENASRTSIVTNEGLIVAGPGAGAIEHTPTAGVTPTAATPLQGASRAPSIEVTDLPTGASEALFEPAFVTPAEFGFEEKEGGGLAQTLGQQEAEQEKQHTAGLAARDFS